MAMILGFLFSLRLKRARAGFALRTHAHTHPQTFHHRTAWHGKAHIARCSASINLSGVRVVSFFHEWHSLSLRLRPMCADAAHSSQQKHKKLICALLRQWKISYHIVHSFLNRHSTGSSPSSHPPHLGEIDSGRIGIKPSNNRVKLSPHSMNLLNLVFRTCFNLNNERDPKS